MLQIPYKSNTSLSPLNTTFRLKNYLGCSKRRAEVTKQNKILIFI
ncbi:hypothetical protein midi_00524 [Candidatus Midichloria mitochondrii IricVA]|uniref:Uncharacterized protein n=1 Tax=Midichloria mitochondrii (strain IricVA) TaxID=696127 RepID=F7XVY0_MIDMI|nr:hypothetical protein midi_00524 [Candidatus Midichloria mitochondrii IricVA]